MSNTNITTTTETTTVTVTENVVEIELNNVGVQGTPGLSGVVSVVSPITNVGSAGSAIVGINQALLSITKSQVSDFTSGTVTSAGTAQQAGTAVFATNASTAVFATTAGTSTTISGTITKSQVSDFTSGTVASASTAQQSGTAVYAVNAGTAVYSTTSGTAVSISGDITKSQVSDFTSGTVTTISGSITKSQVSDFTSGTVTSASTAQQSGTAVFATTSGTATYATNAGTATHSDTSGTAVFANTSGTATFATTSGTATFATNSGTAVFATNASTAVSVSGSAITQSQIVNLVSDLANTAKLNTANTFTVGGHVINNNATGTVPIRVNAIAGQTANLFEIRDSAATNYVAVNSAGTILFGGNSGSFLSGANGRVNVQLSGDNVGLTVRAFATQTADLVKIQNSSGTDLVRVDSAGRGIFPTILAGALTGSIGVQMAVQPTSASTPGFAVRGAASQSVDLLQLQNSAATVLGGFGNTGNLKVRTSTEFSAALNVAAAASTQIGAVIRGAASQSASIQEWQNDGGTALARVLSDGQWVSSAINTSNNYVRLLEANSGGTLQLTRMTAAAGNPGANVARLFLRDGTNAGTLKLVVRAGASGAETTILDNIPQT
jgi:hypothetical protein